MAARTFIVARGRMNELAERVIQGDPGTSKLFVAFYQNTIEVDALLEVHETKAAVDAQNDVCDFTNYGSDSSRALANIVRSIVADEQGFTADDLQIVNAGGATDNDITRAMLYFDLGTAVDTAGSQAVDLGGAKVGGDPTGLDNTSASAGVASAVVAGAPLGTVVPGVATQNWEIDVTVDGGGLQQLPLAIAITDDYDAIAVIMSTATVGATVAFVAGAFVFTSNTTGSTSTVVVGAGTLGVTSDLFAAITAAAAGNPLITFPAPVDGIDPVTYTAAIVIDGGASQPIAVDGDNAQTITALIAELNADTTDGVWSLAGGDIVCISDTTGLLSTIAITDTDLFAAVTDFSSILAAVDGTAASGAAIPLAHYEFTITTQGVNLNFSAGASGLYLTG